jgi:hypothetical protein
MGFVPGSRLEAILDEYALRKMQELSVDQVLEVLAEQGIESLEQLVVARLKDFEMGGDVAKETFIYTQFIYHKERPLPPELLDMVEAEIRHF